MKLYMNKYTLTGGITSAGHFIAGYSSLMFQHLLYKYPISFLRFIYKNMGYCAYHFTILDYRASAHSLDDASGAG